MAQPRHPLVAIHRHWRQLIKLLEAVGAEA
jgi:hypothetical protein